MQRGEERWERRRERKVESQVEAWCVLGGRGSVADAVGVVVCCWLCLLQHIALAVISCTCTADDVLHNTIDHARHKQITHIKLTTLHNIRLPCPSLSFILSGPAHLQRHADNSYDAASDSWDSGSCGHVTLREQKQGMNAAPSE